MTRALLLHSHEETGMVHGTIFNKTAVLGKVPTWTRESGRSDGSRLLGWSLHPQTFYDRKGSLLPPKLQTVLRDKGGRRHVVLVQAATSFKSTARSGSQTIVCIFNSGNRLAAVDRSGIIASGMHKTVPNNVNIIELLKGRVGLLKKRTNQKTFRQVKYQPVRKGGFDRPLPQRRTWPGAKGQRFAQRVRRNTLEGLHSHHTSNV